MKPSQSAAPASYPGRRAAISWCLFDWANSPLPTVIITFVFSAYFARGVVGNEIEGTVLWSHALTIAGLTVAVLAPILGAIADQTGPKKPWPDFPQSASWPPGRSGLCIPIHRTRFSP